MKDSLDGVAAAIRQRELGAGPHEVYLTLFSSFRPFKMQKFDHLLRSCEYGVKYRLPLLHCKKLLIADLSSSPGSQQKTAFPGGIHQQALCGRHSKGPPRVCQQACMECGRHDAGFWVRRPPSKTLEPSNCSSCKQKCLGCIARSIPTPSFQKRWQARPHSFCLSNGKLRSSLLWLMIWPI